MSSLESGIQTRIIAYLKSVGAYPINIAGNAFQTGVPDILVCYKGLWIALEVKAADGSLRPMQRIRIRRIRKAGGIAEEVRSVEKVKDIIATIDAGRTWVNQPY